MLSSFGLHSAMLSKRVSVLSLWGLGASVFLSCVQHASSAPRSAEINSTRALCCLCAQALLVCLLPRFRFFLGVTPASGDSLFLLPAVTALFDITSFEIASPGRVMSAQADLIRGSVSVCCAEQRGAGPKTGLLCPAGIVCL